MRWNGLRLSVTLLTVFPLRGDAAASRASGPDRATAAAAMAWAPVVGLLLGAIAAAVLLAVRRSGIRVRVERKAAGYGTADEYGGTHA